MGELITVTAFFVAHFGERVLQLGLLVWAYHANRVRQGKNNTAEQSHGKKIRENLCFYAYSARFEQMSSNTAYC